MRMSDHREHLSAALADLVHQIDISEYRDGKGHSAKSNLSFIRAQAIVDQDGLSHDCICDALDDCGDDLERATDTLLAKAA